MESDPIGLQGGINTFAYALNNPLLLSDPFGLDAAMCRAALRAAGGVVGGAAGYGCGCVLGGVLGGAGGTVVGPGGTMAGAAGGCGALGPPGGIAGAALGGLAGDKLADAMCDDKKCPPCKLIDGTIVPVGTIGYRFDRVPPSRPHHPFPGDHYNIYKAQQNPNNCQCFWQPQGAQEILPPGGIPIQPFAN